MLIFIGSLLVQVLLSLPRAIAHVAVEIVPELLGSRGAKRAVRNVEGVLDPERG